MKHYNPVPGRARCCHPGLRPMLCRSSPVHPPRHFPPVQKCYFQNCSENLENWGGSRLCIILVGGDFASCRGFSSRRVVVHGGSGNGRFTLLGGTGFRGHGRQRKQSDGHSETEQKTPYPFLPVFTVTFHDFSSPFVKWLYGLLQTNANGRKLHKVKTKSNAILADSDLRKNGGLNRMKPFCDLPWQSAM